MKAVVLAAGEGTRLRPFTNSRPKPMLPVGNKPIMEYIIESLASNGIKDIIVVVGYKKEKIMSYFQDGMKFGVDIHYVHQEKQIGTSHALLCAKELLDDDFIVLAGDNIIDANSIGDLLKYHKIPSVLVTESDNPSKYGVVEIHNGKITGLIEKPAVAPGNLISTGIYLFSPDILKRIEREMNDGALGISNAMQKMLNEIEIFAVKTHGKWADVVYPWQIIEVNSAILKFKGQTTSGTIEDHVVIKGPVVVGAGTTIRSGTYINGPVLIGEGCEIGPNATILPASSIGKNVQIGSYTLISNSVIMDNVFIDSHSHISNSVIDEGTKASPSLMCISGKSFVRIGEEFHKLDNVGALIGQNAIIGSHVSIAPGIVVGAGVTIKDGVRVTENLENGCVVV
ncbi:MAG: sugar phosphate nucleotidyltransferase [Methanomassiliicoccales archaeon]